MEDHLPLALRGCRRAPHPAVEPGRRRAGVLVPAVLVVFRADGLPLLPVVPARLLRVAPALAPPLRTPEPPALAFSLG